jgi:peptidyl-tRNA hydrolase, PTH1 family
MIIIGLGNPGIKYQSNRHNAGTMLVQYLCNLSSISPLEQTTQDQNKSVWKTSTDKLFQYFGVSNDEGKKILVKPNTFMNHSGKAVTSCMRYFAIEDAANIYIAHDDLDIPLGKFKIDFAKGPKVHNGIISVEQAIKTNNFFRIRIGVDSRNLNNQISGEDYALSDFEYPNETKILYDTFVSISTRLMATNKIK